MKKILFFYCCLLWVFPHTLWVHAAELKPGFIQQVIGEGLDPTGMVLAPDGRIFLLEKQGRILVVENEILLSAPFLTLQVDNFNERGMLGITLDPDFDLNGYVYVFYTVAGANHNRVSRFTATGNTARPGSEEVLLELDQLASGVHNGGSMVFGTDGKLYITSGDGGLRSTAQDLGNLSGKILRINPDGSIPPDNPFYDKLEGKNRAIWAYGFRNPFSMAYEPLANRLLVNDVGESTFEEVNEVLPGRNYGWPLVEGPLVHQMAPADYQEPLFFYDHSKGCSIIGAAFYNPSVAFFPRHYVGKFFFADYCTGILSVLDPEETELIDTLVTGLDRPIAFSVSNKGALYVLQRAGLRDGSVYDNTRSANGSLWKIAFTGSGKPFVARNPVDTKVPVGEDAIFEVIASGTPPLKYQWIINEVETSLSDSAVLILREVALEHNNASIVCIISNEDDTTRSNVATLSVTANRRPVPQIFVYDDTHGYKGGDEIRFSGLATDNEDGLLDSTRLSWEIVFHHGEHTHPALMPISGKAEGSYVIPKVGETSTNVWYRLYLTATDSEGLTQSTYRDFSPALSMVTLQTNPANAEVSLDGTIVQTPYTFEAVAGMTRTLEAFKSTRQQADQIYLFDKWETGEDSRIISFEVPEREVTYTVHYKAMPTGAGNGLLGKYYNGYENFRDDRPALIRTDSVINFNWVSARRRPKCILTGIMYGGRALWNLISQINMIL